MADDFGYECVMANGGEAYQTPHFDRLAPGGMRFERGQVQPPCTPARVQLMTGRYDVRNYIEFGAVDRQAGDVTGIGGRWQLGVERDSPPHFGFDEAFLWQHRRRASRYGNPGFERDGESRDFPGGHGPRKLNDCALDFVTRHRDRPFFFHYPRLLTHSPFQSAPDSPAWDPSVGERGNQNGKHFADMVASMDQMVGGLVGRLEELGLREKTPMIYPGDNGTGVDITSRFKREAYPGGQGRGHAGGIHVPLIASGPGRVPAGRVNADLIASDDFLPTLLAAAGAELPTSAPPAQQGETGFGSDLGDCRCQFRPDLSILS